MRILGLLLGIAAAGSPQTPDVGGILRGTGEAVKQFWKQSQAVSCLETMTRRRLDAKGNVKSEQSSAFEYMIVLRESEGGLQVEESRNSVRSRQKADPAPMLVTTGFGTLLLVFHPSYQHSHEYTMPVEDRQGDRTALRVEFRQVADGQSPSCLRVGGRNHPLEWRGTAWLEPRSFSVLRIVAALNKNMEDVGLKSLNVDVVYAPVKLVDLPQEQWLPSSAVIDLETPRQHWRNTHRYTGYRRFTVDTRTITEPPK